MKTLKRLLLLILAPLMLANQCKKENYDTLPPETQTGANTFGCYVNGILFVPKRKLGDNPDATYHRETNSLQFGCYWRFPRIILYVENPRESEYNSLTLGILEKFHAENECWSFVGENAGHVFITKFDTINRIVSGTFEFSARCATGSFGPSHLGNIIYAGDSIVQISDGRFDIKLNIVNEATW